MFVKLMSRFVGGEHLPLRSVIAPLAFVAGLVLAGIAILFIASPKEAPVGDPVVVGRTEWVELNNTVNRHRTEVRAKIDTGADSSSIDTALAEQLGIDLANAPKKIVRSALGREERPLVNLVLHIGGRRIETRATVDDRSELDTPMLLGARDLEGFLVDTTAEKLTTPRGEPLPGTSAGTHRSPILTANARALLAPIPLAAALVVGVRTLIGMQTFGVFAPILLAMSLAHTGIRPGIITCAAMLGAGIATQLLTRRFNLPRIARLAVLLSAFVLALLVVQELSYALSLGLTITNTFPVVVTAAIVERFSVNWEQQQFTATLKLALGTVLVAAVTSAMLQADGVLLMAHRMPFVLVAVGALFSLLLGTYRGLRLTEIMRFRRAAGTELPA